MPIVHIYQTPKTVDQRRSLIKSVTQAFGDALGYPAESVQVWIHESHPDTFGLGGALASDG